MSSILKLNNNQVLPLAINRGGTSSLTPPQPSKKPPVSIGGVRAAMIKKMAVTCTRCNRTFLTAKGLLGHQKAHDDQSRLGYKRPSEAEKRIIDGRHDQNPKAIKSGALQPHCLAAGEGGFWPPMMAGFNGGVWSPAGQLSRINSHEEKNSGDDTSTELDLSLKL